MKKSLFIASILGITFAFVSASVPQLTEAQAYYGSYSTYGSQGCLDLTTFQSYGITDSQTSGQVSLLQEFLNQTGYLSGVSGTFDTGTLGAVINYQNAHGIQPTGTLTPQTVVAINQQSCQGVSTGYVSPSYPVTPYSNGSNCYWTGAANSTYVCTTPGTPVVYPVVTPVQTPIVCNNNSYNSNYYNSGSNYNNCGTGYNGYRAVELSSLSASYNYNATTITLTGYGFSPSGNTVDFGNTVISNVYSSGSTLTFSVPTGYTYGTYSVTVTNAQGGSSNALSFIMNNSNYYGNGSYNNNGNYNNGSYNNCGTGYYSNSSYSNCYQNTSPTLSSISGPTSVQADVTNTWSVSNENSTYASMTANWGDGDTSNSNSTNYGNGGTYSFSHDYLTPGVYTMRITATGSNATVSYQTYTITVTNPSASYGGYYYSRVISNGWNDFRHLR